MSPCGLVEKLTDHLPFSSSFGAIEAVVVKVRQGQNDLMKIELQLVAFHPDFQRSISRMLVFAGKVRKRMGRFGVRHTAEAGLAASPPFQPSCLANECRAGGQSTVSAPCLTIARRRYS